MLPPGLLLQRHQREGHRGKSESADAAEELLALGDDVIECNRKGFYPYTPSTNLLYGLREALLKMLLDEEGLEKRICQTPAARGSYTPRGSRLGTAALRPQSR